MKHNRESIEGYSKWKIREKNQSRSDLRKIVSRIRSYAHPQKGRKLEHRRIIIPCWHATPVLKLHSNLS